jgi:hypothetical protein
MTRICANKIMNAQRRAASDVEDGSMNCHEFSPEFASIRGRSPYDSEREDGLSSQGCVIVIENPA